jgi:hypothetical protein
MGCDNIVQAVLHRQDYIENMRKSTCTKRCDLSLNAASFTAEDKAWVTCPKGALVGFTDIS